MGCTASTTAHMGPITVEGRGRDYLVVVNQQWNQAMGTLEVKKGHKFPTKSLVVKRSGWKTVRIFVSSTFKDFHAEREVLVKKVNGLKQHHTTVLDSLWKLFFDLGIKRFR